MPKRLVYLPDPTLKFYYSVYDKEYFVEHELDCDELGPDSRFNEIVIRPGKSHHNLLETLIKKFKDDSYSQPYFKGIIAQIELFEIMEVPSGKTRKARTRESTIPDIS